MASIASSVFISASISRKISPRITCGSSKNSTSSSWFRWFSTMCDRWTIFSRESFMRRPGPSQDDPLVLGQLALDHLEHVRVGDVGALHLGRAAHQHLAHFLVQAIFDHELL